MDMEPQTTQSSPAIPIAIVAGFAMIAIAIFFTAGRDNGPQQITSDEIQQQTASAPEPRPIDETDYIKGNPNAPILMVEYSDYDCPYCKEYHTTMNRIMDEFGVSGRVAWVYRQFPLAKIHPNSPKISEAALCVGDIAGGTAFWQFTDMLFADRNIEDLTNVTKLPTYAEEAGVSAEAYAACMGDNRMEEKVLASIEDAYNSGARATPYTVVIVGDQEAVINGAQPYEVVRGIITNLLEQLDGSYVPENNEPSA